jgi:hypothetical protein
MTSQKETMMRTCLFLLLALCACQASADGFRCGTRLVITGDSISRLTRACGQPDHSYKARVELGKRGARTRAAVTQWVYGRRGKRDVIVSVRGGMVVKIERS